MMERIRQALKNPSLRARLLMALAALAACALLLGAQGDQGGMTSEEKRLSRALSSVSGAGNVRVTLYYAPKDGAFSSAAQRLVGAVAVAQGAGDIAVRLNLTQALMRLLDLDAQSVLVLTMEEGTR